jgi:phage shock protein C
MAVNDETMRTLYRSRSGIIFGVCRGLANHYDFPVFWLRLSVLFLMMVTAVWPVVLGYLAAALYLKPAPVIPLTDESESEFYTSFTQSKPMALHRLQKKFEQLNHRIQRMEDVVTSRDFSWEQRMRKTRSGK